MGTTDADLGADSCIWQQSSAHILVTSSPSFT